MYHVGNIKNMVEYGYIEDGFLRSRILEPYTEKYLNEQGEVATRTVTVEEQIANLSPEWKPVDAVDENQLACDEANHIMRLVPYDAGDHIGYHYVKAVDNFKMKTQIAALQDELAATDYQVIKCYEAQLVGEPLPYDIQTLHTSRNAIRAQINSIQAIQTQLLSL